MGLAGHADYTFSIIVLHPFPPNISTKTETLLYALLPQYLASAIGLSV